MEASFALEDDERTDIVCGHLIDGFDDILDNGFDLLVVTRRHKKQRTAPQLLKSDDALDKFVQLIRTYFKLDGHHIQFNVVDAATLRAAQENPGQYRDSIVRVAGYSDYFCDLGRVLQDEIIARTEQQSF